MLHIADRHMTVTETGCQLGNPIDYPLNYTTQNYGISVISEICKNYGYFEVKELTLRPANPKLILQGIIYDA